MKNNQICPPTVSSSDSTKLWEWSKSQIITAGCWAWSRGLDTFARTGLHDDPARWKWKLGHAWLQRRYRSIQIEGFQRERRGEDATEARELSIAWHQASSCYMSKLHRPRQCEEPIWEWSGLVAVVKKDLDCSAEEHLHVSQSDTSGRHRDTMWRAQHDHRTWGKTQSSG